MAREMCKDDGNRLQERGLLATATQKNETRGRRHLQDFINLVEAESQCSGVDYAIQSASGMKCVGLYGPAVADWRFPPGAA
jgi:hypothetical protein